MDALRGGRVPSSAGRDGPLADARALLLLQSLPGVGDVGVQRLLERFGGARAALGSSFAAFAAVAGEAAARAREDPSHAERVEGALAWCGREGVAVVPRGAAGYPERLGHLPDPPAVLFLRGDPTLLQRETVAVVGSRRSTDYGRRVARELALALSRSGVVVASGLALGIDGEAHRAALEGPGSTLAVLGSGPDRAHPSSHARLFRRICREGLVVSEFLPGMLPLPYHFPRRNRILAALARIVVVVEAAERSGALITADHALSLGRRVLAVPGSIHAPSSRGTNALILAGATPVLGPDTVLELLHGVGATPPLPTAPPPELGRDALLVWDGLADQPGHVDELARRAGLPAPRTLVALSLLEVSGWARQQPGMRFTRSQEGT